MINRGTTAARGGSSPQGCNIQADSGRDHMPSYNTGSFEFYNLLVSGRRGLETKRCAKLAPAISDSHLKAGGSWIPTSAWPSTLLTSLHPQNTLRREKMSPIVAAVAQMTSTPSVAQNLKTALGLMERASRAGARMLFLPEAADLYVLCSFDDETKS